MSSGCPGVCAKVQRVWWLIKGDVWRFVKPSSCQEAQSVPAPVRVQIPRFKGYSPRGQSQTAAQVTTRGAASTISFMLTLTAATNSTSASNSEWCQTPELCQRTHHPAHRWTKPEHQQTTKTRRLRNKNCDAAEPVFTNSDPCFCPARLFVCWLIWESLASKKNKTKQKKHPH